MIEPMKQLQVYLTKYSVILCGCTGGMPPPCRITVMGVCPSATAPPHSGTAENLNCVLQEGGVRPRAYTGARGAVPPPQPVNGGGRLRAHTFQILN